jgi:hypothetical protein
MAFGLCGYQTLALRRAMVNGQREETQNDAGGRQPD